MKKTVIKAVAALLCLTSLVILCGCSTVSLKKTSSATINFIYRDKSIRESLSDEEATLICDMFNSKIEFVESPSCGFDKDISIVIGGDTFCVACDGCTFVYHENKNLYFRLSQEEHNTLTDIFKNHGGCFPCI